MTTPKTDRRTNERFDVRGPLWGVLELPETGAVVNSSPNGMLVESTACPDPDSVQLAHVEVDGASTTVQSAVRHVRPTDRGRYLIGLEFVTPPVLAVLGDGREGRDGRDGESREGREGRDGLDGQKGRVVRAGAGTDGTEP